LNFVDTREQKKEDRDDENTGNILEQLGIMDPDIDAAFTFHDTSTVHTHCFWRIVDAMRTSIQVGRCWFASC
jgi:hypothetical protein